jgi:predicted 2-oxoglutarate/Fe(II)-dependent dioxygenase YbiX
LKLSGPAKGPFRFLGGEARRSPKPELFFAAYLCTHFVQPKVGHYGVFSGRRWQHHIDPVVRNVIHVSQ